MKDYIKIKDLVIDYGESLAVDKINIDIKKGSLVTLLGPSGCGKSTTLNALAGLITPTAGKLIFNGKDVTRTSPSNRGIGLVFQSYALYPHMSVYENIAFSLRSSKEFKKEIETHNQSIDYDIWKKLWLSMGNDEAEIDNHINNVREYRRLVLEKAAELKVINNKHNAKVTRAKELIENEKLRRDGKIKASSEKMLSFVEEQESLIEKLNTKKKIILSKDKNASVEEFDAKIKEINDLIEEKNKLYEADIERYKKDFKDAQPLLKEKRDLRIKEANEKKKTSLDELKVNYSDKIRDLSKDFQKSLKVGNSLSAKAKKVTDEKLLSKLNELSKNKKTVSHEIDVKVKDVVEKVGITQNLEKMVTNLSGGQQQRVAISRTLVKNPDILLLDEPLSNLDAKMRISTREWIRNLQQELGITTVFVTHDQEEAMSISDEIVCMSVGHVQQKAAPMDMYHQPANKFVAGFLGMPMMNFFTEGKIAEELAKKTKQDIKKATFGCRPEHVKLTEDLQKGETAILKLKAEVQISEAYGREVLVTAKVEDELIRFFTDEEKLKRGDEIEIAFRKSKVYAFERKGDEKTISRF